MLNYITESGCPGTAFFSPRVYGKPKANFTYIIPCGNSLDLSFSDVSPFSDSWKWYFGDGGSYFWQNPTHTYNDTGRYAVTFINSIGHCSDTIVKEVYANILPSSVAIIKAENTCTGTRGTVTFDQRSVRASGGTWDFGDGTIIPYDSSAHAVAHTYTATGTYQVRLTSYYGNCVLISTRTVKVLLKQAPLLTANKTQICASDQLTIQITNLQTNPFAGNFQWGQYSVTKIEYNTGGSYTGFINNYTNWNYTNYSSTLSNFTAGVTKMRAIVTDGYNGCSDTTNYIDLQVNGPVVGFKVQNTGLCFKSPFVFIDTSRSATSTPLTSWAWDFGDGVTQLNANNSSVQHVYANPGRYLVRLNVTDATGCTASSSYYVNARGTKAAFTPSGLFIPNVPLNTTVTFYNNSNSYNTSPAYLWQYGDGSTSTGFSGSHTYTQAGTDTVLLIVSDPSIPCSDTAQKIIIVKDFNTAFSFTTSFMGTASCPPLLVRINNLSVGFTRLLWDFGDGTTSTSSYYPSHIYPNPGVYRITLYTYGYNGLTGTYIDSVEVKSPSAQISADVLQGCLSQTVNLQATSQNAVSYLWDFGNGLVNTGATALSHQYLGAGVYTPKLIVKDANGCPASAGLPDKIVIDSLNIKIGAIPSLLCDSALIQFSPEINSFAATTLGTALTYKWDFGTGNPADTANIRNPSFRYVTPGTYLVKLRVVSPYGCVKETTETIIVHQKANGTITALPEVCQDGTILFAASATPAGNLQWNWTFGNGNTSALQAPPLQAYTTAGAYTVTLLVTKNGCIDTTTHQLIVHPKPVVNALPREHILCRGNNVTLSAEGGTLYHWTPATGLSNFAISNPVASPGVTTRYRVQVTTDKGCTNNDSVLITVAQPIQVQLPNAADLCKGASLQLNASGAAGYQWINNVAGLSNTAIPNPVAGPAINSVYTVVGTDVYACFKDTASITVTVRNLPTVSAGPDIQIQGNVPHQLSATGSSDVTSWLWSPADRLSCASCPSPIATPKMETVYTVKVSNQWGCTAADTLLVKLNCSSGQVHIPAAFTPNNDGKNDVFYIAGSGVKIIKYLRIYNRWGEVMFEHTNFAIDDRSTGWDGRYKGQAVGTGTYVYLAEMECSSGELFTRKGTVTVIQ